MKVKPLSPVVEETARRVLTDADVRCPQDINIEAIAARHDVLILYGPVATARASIVSAGKSAIVRIDERAKDRPWGRFTAAHELGHHKMHTLADHFLQCVDAKAKRSQEAYDIERQANDFAAALLIPSALGATYCTASRPSVDDVERLARTFNTSFEMSAIRMTELTTGACAVTVAENGLVKWALESLAFPGRIVKKRKLDARSVAARLPKRASADCEREVPGSAWGGDEPFVERAMWAGPGRVLSWITPASDVDDQEEVRLSEALRASVERVAKGSPQRPARPLGRS